MKQSKVGMPLAICAALVVIGVAPSIWHEYQAQSVLSSLRNELILAARGGNHDAEISILAWRCTELGIEPRAGKMVAEMLRSPNASTGHIFKAALVLEQSTPELTTALLEICCDSQHDLGTREESLWLVCQIDPACQKLVQALQDLKPPSVTE